MYLGYIVGDEHPLLQTISMYSIEEHTDKPIVIVGMNIATSLYPELDVTEKKIKNNIYYIFSQSESDKHEESLNTFLYYCYKELTQKFVVVKNYLAFSDIVLLKTAFIYETKLFITITSGEYIYYLDKKIYKYFTEKNINSQRFIKKLKELYPLCSFYSWNTDFYFQSYLKTINYYISLKDFKTLHFFDSNIDLYIGAVCLEWLKILKTANYPEETLQLWNRAYDVENYLSATKIRIDRDKLNSLEEKMSFKNLTDDEHIRQICNGTDKITGRIYSSSNGLSLQTLPEIHRDIVIAEPKSVLVGFDYNYFEYSLLYQICNMECEDDPHLKLAEVLFKDKEYRDIAKGINYSILFGQSIENTIKDIKNKYPNLKINSDWLYSELVKITKPFSKLKEKLEEELKQTNVIYNYYGRNIYPQKDYACLNNYIQSTAADLVIIKIDKLKKYLSQYPTINRILLQQYDSILFNFSIDIVENTDLLDDIIEILESPEKGLKGKTTMQYGKNWKKLKN